MTEGTTCYERDEMLCEDQMCLRVGCKLRNERLAMNAPAPTELEKLAVVHCQKWGGSGTDAAMVAAFAKEMMARQAASVGADARIILSSGPPGEEIGFWPSVGTEVAGCSCPFDGCAPCPACLAASPSRSEGVSQGEVQSATVVTDEMVQEACEIYGSVYVDDDKDMGDAMRAALEAVIPAQTPFNGTATLSAEEFDALEKTMSEPQEPTESIKRGAALLEKLYGGKVHAQASEESAIDLLAKRISGAEVNYRNAYELHGAGNMKTGRAWDELRRAGNAIRKHFHDREEGSELPSAQSGSATK